MDWHDTVDWAEPSNMDRDDLLECIRRRLDNFWDMRHDDVSLKDDIHFIHLVFHRILTGEDYDPAKRPRWDKVKDRF